MQKLTLVGALLASTALVGLTATAAQADTAPSTAKASDPSGATSVGELLVRAERREESIQKVPLAVSVVTTAQLKASNFTGLTDLQYLSPSIQYNQYQGGGFEVRGVGTQSFNTSEEQEVAVVIDDVIQGTPETNLAPPFYEALSDIDHIEVLKGPQGTLFGKNSSAGVLQIITKQPQLGVFSDDTSLSYGSRNEIKLNDVINIPLGDTAAIRVDGYDFGQDGFEHNLYTDRTIGNYQEYGLRVKALWEPSDKLHIWAIGDYHRASNDANGIWTLRNCGSGDGGFSPCQVDAPYGVTAGPRNVNIADAGLINAVSQNVGGSLHIEYNLDWATLTSITAYYDLRENGAVNVDQTPTNFLSEDARPVHSEQFTQELRLSSPSSSKLEYTAGLYFYTVHTRDQDTLAGTLGLEPSNSVTLLGIPGPGASVIHVTTDSYAGYGQLTYHLTDQLRLIGGLRVTHDNVTSAQNMTAQSNVCQIGFAFGAPCLPATYPPFPPYFNGTEPFSLPTTPIGTTTSATNLSGKIGLEYNFTPDIMGYFTYARGYKGPAIGYNPTEGFEVTPIKVDPETSEDYEIGLKTQFLDRRVTLNIDGFYTKFNNFQAQTYLYDSADPALSAFVLDNAGGLLTEGLEVDGQARVTPELTLNGSVTFAPTKFTQYNVPCTTGPAGAGLWVNQPIPGGGAACFAGPGGQRLFNAAGYPLPNAPKVDYTLSANYKHEFSNDYAVGFNVNWNWRSSEYTVVADPNTIVNGYGLLGANLAFGPSDNRWQVSVFGRNILNQYYVAGIFPSFFDDGTNTGLAHPVRGYSNIPNPDAMRTVGVRLDVKFGG